MRRLGFSRSVGVLLLVGGLLVAVAACVLASRLLTALPLFGRTPAPAAPIRFTGLPTPLVTRPQWTSYTYTGPINDLALGDGLIWAATDGGLVVWDGAGAAVRFAAEHGLAANRVNSVAIGRDGAIWAGTAAGLSRYDGRAWQTFTTADGLPDDAVYDVVVDRDGLVWAGTGSGLARYDGNAWRAYRSGGLFVALPSDEVYALTVDSANRLWVATSGGLVRLERARWLPLPAPYNDTELPVVALAAGPDGVVWGATEAELVRFDGDAIDAFAHAVSSLNVLPAFSVVGLAAAADGAVYAAYAGQGPLERLDPLTGDREFITAGPRADEGDTNGALLLDESSALWAGVGDSVRQLAGRQSSVLAGPSELPANALTDVAHDGRALWVASTVGLARFDGRWQSFGVADGLPTEDTRALAVAPDGALWAAFDTPLRGLARYRPDGWQTVTCPTAAPTSAEINDAAPTADALWFATATGVSRFDGANWQTFDRRDGLPDDAVNALAAHGDTVWTATARGIARYDGSWRVVTDEPAIALAATPGGPVWAYDGRELFRVDEDGTRVAPPLPTTVRDLAATDEAVWLATPDGALRYDGVWTVFTPDEGLPSIDVTAIGAGEDGRVWAATSGDEQQIEIAVFDGAHWGPHPSRDAAAEQLTDNRVLRILAAPDGDVWLNTFASLERQHNGDWSALSFVEGFPSVTALAWAYDTVWAGTEAGLYGFDGQSWQAYDVPATGQSGPAVSALAVTPTGELWVAQTPGQPNPLRYYDGTTWTNVPLPAPTMFVTQMAFTAAGQLVAVAYDELRVLLGLYDGQAWTWHTSDALQMDVGWLGVAPDGRLWLTGLSLDSATLPEVVDSLIPGAPEPTSNDWAAVAVFEVGPNGLGEEVGRFRAADIVISSWHWNGSLHPIAFGPDGQVYVAGHEAVYVFDGGDEIVPAATLDLPLPFARYTSSVAVAADGRLWVGTDAGAAVWDGRAWRSTYAPPRLPIWWGSVNTLLPRADSGIVLGTSGGGLGLYTGRGFTGLTDERQRPAEWEQIRAPYTALVYRAAGELWAATDGGGVTRLTATEWQLFVPDATLAAGVTSLAATDGRLWLGTTAGRVAVEPAGDSCRFVVVEPSSWVSDALRDGQGNVWLATNGEGVLRLSDGEEAARELTGDIQRIALSPNGELWFTDDRQPWLLRYRPGGGDDAWSRLPLDLELTTPNMDTETVLAVGPNLDLWLGGSTLEHRGLARFSGGQWSQLTTADGLADNWVLDVVVAPDGAVWLATYGGVSRFQP